MREIVFKNLTGDHNKKRDLCIREVVTHDDFTATIERRCIYFVRERVYVEDPKNLKKLEAMKKPNDIWKKKHFHILRDFDTETGEDKLFCKVAGNFYAIAGHYVFSIAFVQSFKVNLEALPLA